MSQTVRQLLTELAWIEDSIRQVPLTRRAVRGIDCATPSLGLNPDLVWLAEREREIVAELRRHHSAPN